jgi:hypothetical protein
MDHLGIDVHKMESQLCIVGEEGQLSEPRIRTTPCGSPPSWATARAPASSGRNAVRHLAD